MLKIGCAVFYWQFLEPLGISENIEYILSWLIDWTSYNSL